MNISDPVSAASAKAAQVQRNISPETRLKGRSVEAMPTMRRSTTRMVPNTNARAMTWSASSVGNRYSEWRMDSAMGSASSDCSVIGRSGLGPGQGAPDVVVRDEAAEKDNGDPDQ